jgi:hypothetical protein
MLRSEEKLAVTSGLLAVALAVLFLLAISMGMLITVM